VQPKKDRNKPFDDILHELNTLLLSLPDGKKEQEVSYCPGWIITCIALADTSQHDCLIMGIFIAVYKAKQFYLLSVYVMFFLFGLTTIYVWLT
jgi:hypothetical protein